MKMTVCYIFLASCLLSYSFSLAQNIESIRIGSQIWMAENLNVVTFRNGDTIPQALTNEEWEKAEKAKQPAWCYYDNEESNGFKYGKLYNWYAVNDPRGLAPGGWRIPRSKEWKELTDYLGGWKVAVAKLKNKEGWLHDGNGNNESGFSALPGGRRSCYKQDSYEFIAKGNWGYWWTSSKFTKKTAKARSMYSNGTFQWLDWNKGEGMSVRCVRDK
jgi:uncharacterized protein (TIGR02145 family)